MNLWQHSGAYQHNLLMFVTPFIDDPYMLTLFWWSWWQPQCKISTVTHLNSELIDKHNQVLIWLKEIDVRSFSCRWHFDFDLALYCKLVETFHTVIQFKTAVNFIFVHGLYIITWMNLVTIISTFCFFCGGVWVSTFNTEAVHCTYESLVLQEGKS